VDRGGAQSEILFIEEVEPLEVFEEGRDEGFGEHREAISRSLSVADGDLPEREVDVLDAEAVDLEEAEAGAVEDLGHEAVGAREGGEEAGDLLAGEHRGQVV
jgi:hypothetical protein